MNGFDIPVVLFLYRRDKVVDVIKRVGQVKPQKVYLLGDNGRTDAEKKEVQLVREKAEKAIDWECTIIKNYAEENRGVYQNIGEGAKWVLEQEKWAIFLEDDNLPEVSFFSFCKEMLHRYEQDTRILWICGTNYLGRYLPDDGSSYMFTRHMLPCGWASWGEKFRRFYDGQLLLCDDPKLQRTVAQNYYNKRLYKQYRVSWLRERKRMRQGKRPISWDYQMDFSIKANSLYGICPCNNQIKNIGTDTFATHTAKTLSDEMTRRLTSMDSYELKFPLKHPKTVITDPVFEKKIYKILLWPWPIRMKLLLSWCLREMFHIPPDMRIVSYIKGEK